MGKVFSGLLKKTKETQENISNLKSENSLPVFLNYDNILLRVYFDIATNGTYEDLIVSGNATIEQCKDEWNRLLVKLFEKSGSFDYLGYLDNLEGYNSFLQEHNITIAQLLILHFQIDDEVIADLNERGYNIDIEHGKKAYSASLAKAMIRSNHLLSRIKMKANDMESFTDGLKDDAPTTYDEVMATLMLNLGFTVPDDITLARYNEYRRLIKQKSKSENYA